MCDAGRQLDSVRKIDLSNSVQVEVAWRHYRHNREAVNFYLEQCVLPTDTQTYPAKLGSSAWDLAESTGGGSTVGFSGTNDHALLLPTQVVPDSIRQQLMEGRRPAPATTRRN